MIITVTRKWYTRHSTIGELRIDKHPELGLFTLEDRVRPAGIKIPGQTAIPAGSYHLDVNFSNRFQRFMPLLLDVPNFEGVRLHQGNDAVDSSGCLLVGSTRGQDFIGASKVAFLQLWNALVNKIGSDPSHPGMSAFRIKEPTTIVIVDTQSPIS